MKILIISHGHPTFSPGGGEIAAYELFKGLTRAGHDASFLARVGSPHTIAHNGTRFQTVPHTPSEYLYFSDGIDHFLQSGLTIAEGPNLHNLRTLLKELKPDVIHFQHSAHLGLEWLRICRECIPGAAIVYTLHEYLLICNRDGQMLRTYDSQPCDRATPSACHRCFPDISVQSFGMRRLFVQAHLENVDAFVAPSNFLLRKYVEWGIEESRIHFIANGRTLQSEAPPRPGDDDLSGRLSGKSENGKQARRSHFGFFGQINPFKGVLVLLDAMARLASRRDAGHIQLFLHGSHLELQSREFQERFAAALGMCKDNVTVLPPYRAEELPGLMRNIDWVVVPSIWYENSPLVIQEAYMHRRPVICSGIGGMAEKVIDGQTGLHFRVGSSEDLARTLLRAAAAPELWKACRAHIPAVFTVEQSIDAHMELYLKCQRLRQRALATTA